MFIKFEMTIWAAILISFVAVGCSDDDKNDDPLPENSNQLGQKCNPDEYVPNCQGMNARNCIEVIVEKDKTHHVNDAVCTGEEYKVNGKKAACRVLMVEKWAGCYVDCEKIDEEIEFNGKNYVCTQGDGFKYYREKVDNSK